MISRWTLAIFAVTIGSVHAQNFYEDEVTVQELTMPKCTIDPNAAAMILFDRGTSRIFQGGTTKVTRHVRIKFFTKEKIDIWSSHSFILDKGDQSLTRLKATTYNLVDGKIVATPMGNDAVFKSKYDKYRKQVRFTLSNVREGSVIDIQYAYMMSDATIPAWQFQSTIPAQESRYEVYVPEEVEYTTELQGLLPLSVHNKDEKKFMAYWVMYRVPAFQEEPYMASDEDFTATLRFLPKRDFSYWNVIVTNLHSRDDFGDYIHGPAALTNRGRELTTGLTTESQKFIALMNYVKANVSWNGEVEKFGEQPPRETVEKKKGSSADINILLLGLLHGAKLKADPVLISTRGHGLPKPMQPSLWQFNDVVVQVEVDKRKYLVDATDKYLNPYSLPERCINASGLVINRDSSRFIPITTNKTRKIANAKLVLTADGTLSGSIALTLDGHHASAARARFTEDGKEKRISSLSEELHGEVNALEVENLDNTAETFKEKMEVNIPNHGQVSGPLMYLDPFIFNRTTDNPFKEDQRQYPIDFPNTLDNYYVAQIQIPDGYQVEELPKMATIALPNNGGRFLYNVTATGNQLTVTCQISRNTRVFGPEYYKFLKEFYTLIVAKQAEQVVLKKKS